jgi:hypothetical protein
MRLPIDNTQCMLSCLLLGYEPGTAYCVRATFYYLRGRSGGRAAYFLLAPAATTTSPSRLQRHLCAYNEGVLRFLPRLPTRAVPFSTLVLATFYCDCCSNSASDASRTLVFAAQLPTHPKQGHTHTHTHKISNNFKLSLLMSNNVNKNNNNALTQSLLATKLHTAP